MTEIERKDMEGYDCGMFCSATGEFVHYDDHAKIVAELEETIRQQDTLIKHLYTTCEELENETFRGS